MHKLLAPAFLSAEKERSDEFIKGFEILDTSHPDEIYRIKVQRWSHEGLIEFSLMLNPLFTVVAYHESTV